MCRHVLDSTILKIFCHQHKWPATRPHLDSLEAFILLLFSIDFGLYFLLWLCCAVLIIWVWPVCLQSSAIWSFSILCLCVIFIIQTWKQKCRVSLRYTVVFLMWLKRPLFRTVSEQNTKMHLMKDNLSSCSVYFVYRQIFYIEIFYLYILSILYVFSEAMYEILYITLKLNRGLTWDSQVLAIYW